MNLLRAIRQVSHAISRDERRVALSALRFEVLDERQVVVATDGHRMSVAYVDDLWGENSTLACPKGRAPRFKKAADLTAAVEAQREAARSGIPQFPTPYVDWKQVIPVTDGYRAKLVVERQPLLEALSVLNELDIEQFRRTWAAYQQQVTKALETRDLAILAYKDGKRAAGPGWRTSAAVKALRAAQEHAEEKLRMVRRDPPSAGQMVQVTVRNTTLDLVLAHVDDDFAKTQLVPADIVLRPHFLEPKHTESAAITIGLNLKYFADALMALSGSTVRIAIDDVWAAIRIDGEDGYEVIMPCRL